MANEMIINRTTLKGAKWQIVANAFGAALYLGNFDGDGYHFSGRFFKGTEEANAYLDKIDEKVHAPVRAFTHSAVPVDYYGESGKYYGD